LNSIRLCKFSDIEEQDSQGFLIKLNGQKIKVIAIRLKNKIFTFENPCPHIGTPLDFKPGKFLNIDKTYIICSTHGALFQINDGYCVSGPCAGLNLRVLPNKIENEYVFLINN